MYAGLGDFSPIDPVVYDRQVVSHYYTNYRLIFTLGRRLLQTKDGGTLSVIRFDLEELHSFLR